MVRSVSRQREMPDFAAVHERVGDEVRLVGINPIDSASAMTDLPIGWALSTSSTVTHLQNSLTLGTLGFPYTVFVDADGVIVEMRAFSPKKNSSGSSMIISISKGDPTYDAFVSSGARCCGESLWVRPAADTMFFLADTSEAASGLGRASIRRALTVSSALTAGFMTVFIVVGIVTYNFTSWIQQNARYATIVIAVGLIGLGIAMLSGRSVGLALPRLDVGGRDRVSDQCSCLAWHTQLPHWGARLVFSCRR